MKSIVRKISNFFFPSAFRSLVDNTESPLEVENEVVDADVDRVARALWREMSDCYLRNGLDALPDFDSEGAHIYGKKNAIDHARVAIEEMYRPSAAWPVYPSGLPQDMGQLREALYRGISYVFPNAELRAHAGELLLNGKPLVTRRDMESGISFYEIQGRVNYMMGVKPIAAPDDVLVEYLEGILSQAKNGELAGIAFACASRSVRDHHALYNAGFSTRAATDEIKSYLLEAVNFMHATMNNPNGEFSNLPPTSALPISSFQGSIQ